MRDAFLLSYRTPRPPFAVNISAHRSRTTGFTNRLAGTSSQRYFHDWARRTDNWSLITGYWSLVIKHWSLIARPMHPAAAPLYLRWLAWLIVASLPGGIVLANPALSPVTPAPPAAQLRFQVRLASTLAASNTTGRLMVILGHPRSRLEPRLDFAETGMAAAPFLARDVHHFSVGETAALGREHACFPLPSLDHLTPGTYRLQALLTTNRDLRFLNSPGSFLSTPAIVTLSPDRTTPIELALDQRLPEETPPTDTDSVRFLKIRSGRLSEFHGRPIFLRAAVVLPRSFDSDPTRRYPLLVMIGGFGQRYTVVTNGLVPGGNLASARKSAPEFLLLHLDGAGPWGDPYQVNSANNGPYGDALTQELIPYVEQVFRGLGQPHARLLTGGSTGGWVSLALQIFYPDYFGGCWSGFPDSPDFRAFQLVDIYSETNAFLNAAGFERPSKRQPNGDVAFTMRHEVQLENALGAGNQFTASGGQWGSWAAVHGPVGTDGAPTPPWNPQTGTIDRAAVAAWQNYDLRLLLDRYWTNLAPRLGGKLHAWVGLDDDYFLDGGLRLFANSLTNRPPALEASIHFEPGVGHGWNPKPWGDLLQEMSEYIERTAPKSAEAMRDALMRARYGHGVACPHCRGGR